MSDLQPNVFHKFLRSYNEPMQQLVRSFELLGIVVGYNSSVEILVEKLPTLPPFGAVTENHVGPEKLSVLKKYLYVEKDQSHDTLMLRSAGLPFTEACNPQFNKHGRPWL